VRPLGIAQVIRHEIKKLLLRTVTAPMLTFFAFSFTTNPRYPDIDLRLTQSGAGHMFLRKEQIKIANWDQTYEKS
jgi:hypothetical protein